MIKFKKTTAYNYTYTPVLVNDWFTKYAAQIQINKKPETKLLDCKANKIVFLHHKIKITPIHQ